MLASLRSIAITGIDAVPVDVELDQRYGSPYVRLVGLPDKAVQEAADRIRSAMGNSGYEFPCTSRLVYSLAPAELKKEGAVYDLPLALVTLMTSGQVQVVEKGHYLVMGELSLGGDLRPIRGALAAAITARELEFDGVVLPLANAAEAAAVDGIRTVGVENLRQAAEFFAGAWQPPAEYPAPAPDTASGCGHSLCYSDMRGQELVKRAMTVSAAGGHHCLLLGPPGSGKTMAAQRLPTILPPMSIRESLDTTKIHSVAGEIPPGQGLLWTRPFRAPHHNASLSGLVGGGTIPRPGELSMAHNGVLFLDEAPEFPRQLLETLRQPLEDGAITISRASGSETFPARVLLVMSMNLCPCGKRGDPKRTCRCSERQIANYVGKISGPLLDRIDIHKHVWPVDRDELMQRKTGATSESMAKEVAAAREIQLRRYGDSPTPVNAAMTPSDIEKYCQIDTMTETILRVAATDYGLSARAISRILKVARTAADLEASESIQMDHVLEAIEYRRDEGRR